MSTPHVDTAIAEVSARLSAGDDLPSLLAMIADQSRRALGASSTVIVLMGRRHRLEDDGVHVVGESLEDGVNVSDVPDVHTDGPALLSAREGVVAMIDDLSVAEDTRWPAYRQRAMAVGVRAVRAFPIRSLGTSLGSLVVHAAEPWGTSRSHTFGQVMADLAAVALGSAAADRRRLDIADNVEKLLERGVVIASATGMLAEVLGLDVDEASRTLGELARAHGTTEASHAATIVAAHDGDPTASDPAWARMPDHEPPPPVDG